MANLVPVAEDDPRVHEIVGQPYARLLEPAGDGWFAARIVELPGCISEGASAEEALANLEEAFAGVVASLIEHGDAVPPPIALRKYSGRVVLRFPPSLHAAAVRRAEVEGISLNRLLSDAVARYIGP